MGGFVGDNGAEKFFVFWPGEQLACVMTGHSLNSFFFLGMEIY